MKRKICVVTGGRSDYGLLHWLMKDLACDPDVRLQVAVTGMHLSHEFGYTWRQVEADGFTIDEKIESLLSSDSTVGIAKSIGIGIIGFADAFARLRPDLLVLLGDRFEILAAATAAMTARIPIAHIHGGELTEGLIDEAIRHSITKMSALHFVSAEVHRKRVVQLGENPERVFNFGAPGLDTIKRIPLLSRTELEQDLNVRFGAINLLVTYHPVTLSANHPDSAMTALLAAISHFPEAHVFFTYANADTDGRIINTCIDNFKEERNGRVFAFSALGQRRYLSIAAQADLIVGNSSSGLIEAPALKIPTINIGDRQNGRLRAKSVIDCKEDTFEIVAAMRKGLDSKFRTSLLAAESPYGTGDASRKIKDVLVSVDPASLIMKSFHDIPDVK